MSDLGITLKAGIPRNAVLRTAAERKAAELGPSRCRALVPVMQRVVESDGRIRYPYVMDGDGDTLYRVCDNPSPRHSRRCGTHRGMPGAGA